jgi:hypothetical protein
VTTSNLAPAAVLYGLALVQARRPRPILALLLGTVVFLGTLVTLVQVQRAALGTRNPFDAEVLREELEDVRRDVLGQGEEHSHRQARTPSELGRNLFVLDFVAAVPGRTPLNGTSVKLEYSLQPLRFNPIGLAGLAAWLLLWGSGLLRNVRALVRRDEWPPRFYYLGLGIVVAGNGVLLTLYNPGEMYLYTPLILLPVLLLGINRDLLRTGPGMALLAGTAGLFALNNLTVILAMIR